MRLRFSVPLPGPFALTSGGRPSGSGIGVALFAGLIYLGAWFEFALPMLAIHGAVLLVVVLVALARRRGGRT